MTDAITGLWHQPISSTVHLPTLPAELYDLIVDELGSDVQENRQALQMCMSVSLAFRERASRHLFRVIHILRSSPLIMQRTQERLYILHNLVSQANTSIRLRSIVPHIRGISICVYFEELDVDDSSEEICDLISDILLAIWRNPDSRVEAFRLTNDGTHSAYETWTDFPFTDAFEKYMYSPYLKHVTFHGIKAIPLCILYGTSITHVDTYDSEYSADVKQAGDNLQKDSGHWNNNYSVVSLKADLYFLICRYVGNPNLRFGLLKHLDLSAYDAKDLLDFSMFFKLTPMVEELFLDYYFMSYSLTEWSTCTVDLESHLKHLSTLSLSYHSSCFGLPLTNRVSMESLENASFMLEKCPPWVKHVKLILQIPGAYQKAMVIQQEKHMAHWDLLDNCISPKSYPLLSTFELNIQTSLPPLPTADLQTFFARAENHLRSVYLPRLSSFGFLKISISKFQHGIDYWD